MAKDIYNFFVLFKTIYKNFKKLFKLLCQTNIFYQHFTKKKKKMKDLSQNILKTVVRLVCEYHY
jgi:hypothetical protein